MAGTGLISFLIKDTAELYFSCFMFGRSAGRSAGRAARHRGLNILNIGAESPECPAWPFRRHGDINSRTTPPGVSEEDIGGKTQGEVGGRR